MTTTTRLETSQEPLASRVLDEAELDAANGAGILEGIRDGVSGAFNGVLGRGNVTDVAKRIAFGTIVHGM